ncbi:HNH endonuclease signature motif containing protein [Cupriavidus campinensis]
MASFGRRVRSKDGLNYYCKECSVVLGRKSYAKNRESYLARKRKAYSANPAVYIKRIAEQQRKHAARCNARNAVRYASKMRATPSWADQEAIKQFYETATALGMLTGEWHEVDHIVPLRSKLVCGLHCQANLQILTAKENMRKGNRHWPDMPGEFL